VFFIFPWLGVVESLDAAADGKQHDSDQGRDYHDKKDGPKRHVVRVDRIEVKGNEKGKDSHEVERDRNKNIHVAMTQVFLCVLVYVCMCVRVCMCVCLSDGVYVCMILHSLSLFLLLPSSLS